MKTTKKILLGVLAFAVVGILATSCKKKTSDDPTDTTAANDNEQQETVGNESNNIADNAVKSGSVNGRYGSTDGVYDALSNCATITYDTTATNGVRTLTIDFGTVNCTCADGRTRRGKIIVTHTGHYFESGSVKTMTFDGFYRNDNHVEGTRTITNNGLNASGQMSWTVVASNMKITLPDGTSHTWNSTRTRTMVAGQGTADWLDDAYDITGSATGTNRKGLTYTANITTPLHRNLSCHWISSGKIEITPQGKAVRTVDFGDGTCDDKATVTLNGNIRTITLH